MQISIRPTTVADTSLLPEIERSGASTFLTLPDLAWIATDRVLDEAQHQGFIAAGLHWVAVDDGDRPIGFLAAERFGPELHIWELSVRAQWQGRGIGRRLIAAACAAAKAAGLAAATLTTFRDVPWNAPFYTKVGFAILEGDEIDERLAKVLAYERELGLPRERRCAMRRVVVF
jgi:GNAT superfamily N-acetyltransferase